MFCYIVYHSIPSKYTKLEESFGVFINRSPVRFENEKSQLHTIVYGGTGKGKTYFVRQFLKSYLDQDQDQDQDRRSIIIVCKDERDWINPETGQPSTEFTMCDINMTTSTNMHNFKDSVFSLDDMGKKLNGDMT